MWFFNKKKKNEDFHKGDSLYDKFLENSANYVKYSKSLLRSQLPNNDYNERYAKEYCDAVNYYVNYMRTKFNDEELSTGQSFNLDIQDMIKDAKVIVKYMIMEPKYPSIIYILDDTRFPHFHTNGKYILETEGIDCLPGLDYMLRKSKMNSIFEGMEILEARALLKQMRLLPPGNNLDQTIESHRENTKIYNEFLLSIIYMLLIGENKNDVVRARLFAASFNVDFDFTPYDEKEKTEDKKLNKEPNTDC